MYHLALPEFSGHTLVLQMLSVKIYFVKSLGPDYLTMHLAKLKTQVLQLFANIMGKNERGKAVR